MNLLPLVDLLNSAWLSISALVLNLIVALVLLLAGLLVARGLAWVVTFLLKLVQLDKGAKQIRFNTILDKGEIKKTASELLGDLAYWVVVLITVVSVAKLFKLPVDIVLGNVIIYLGIVFLAAIVLGVGLFLASLLASIVKLVAGNIGIEGAKTLARVIYYVVVIFTFLVVLAELGVDVRVIGQQLNVIIGAIGLAAAIAFGLGCKDMAADFLHNLFKGK